MNGVLNEISPQNSRFDQSKSMFLSTTPVLLSKSNQSLYSLDNNRTFTVNLPPSSRSSVIDEEENLCVPIYTQRKAKPAPLSTWKAPLPIPKSSTLFKTSIESSLLPSSTFHFPFD